MTTPITAPPADEASRPAYEEELRTYAHALLVASGAEREDADAVQIAASLNGYTISGLTRSRAFLMARSVIAEFQGDTGPGELTVVITATSVTVTVQPNA